MFIVLIQFYNYIFKLRIKHIKAFISYWMLFYKNFMKFLYVNINNFLKIYISILFKQYKNIYSFFFFLKKKKEYLKNNKLYPYFNRINQLLNLKFYKKVRFFIFFF